MVTVRSLYLEMKNHGLTAVALSALSGGLRRSKTDALVSRM